jgi:phosphoadenosine phosphosulfate reductase
MDLEQKAIQRIQTASEMSLHHYGQPLICTYSGGKDSDVQLELFKRSGVPFEVLNSHTTADAPQTVYHIREKFRELELQGIKCDIDYHIQPDGSRITMWNLIPNKLMPPTRRMRYCCQVLKEGGGSNRMIATGVRWGESSKRKNREVYESITSNISNKAKVSDEKMLLTDNDDTRKLFEQCQLKAKTVVNPIIDWEDSDIWEYIESEHICTNCLYKMGYDRVGCIGCPIAGKGRWKEFSDFPTYKNAYIKAFDRMLEVRKAKGKDTKWKSGEEVFLWWMEDENIIGQMTLDDFMEGV